MEERSAIKKILKCSFVTNLIFIISIILFSETNSRTSGTHAKSAPIVNDARNSFRAASTTKSSQVLTMC